MIGMIGSAIGGPAFRAGVGTHRPVAGKWDTLVLRTLVLGSKRGLNDRHRPHLREGWIPITRGGEAFVPARVSMPSLPSLH